MLFVVCRILFVIRCVMFVVCVVCRLSFVGDCSLFDVCCLLFVVGRGSLIGCDVLLAVRCALCVGCCVLYGGVVRC